MGVIAGLPDGALWREVSGAIERHELAAVPQSTAMPGVARVPRAPRRPAARGRHAAARTVARATLAQHGLAIEVVVGRDPQVRPKPSGDGLRLALHRLGPSRRTP